VSRRGYKPRGRLHEALTRAVYTWGDNREQATGRASRGVSIGEALAHGWRAGLSYRKGVQV